MCGGRLVKISDSQIDLRASCDGCQVPRFFCKHNSLSDERIETTTVRWSGFSGVAAWYAAPSWRAASAGCAAMISFCMASDALTAGIDCFSERTDMAVERGASLATSAACSSRCSGLLYRWFGSQLAGSRS